MTKLATVLLLASSLNALVSGDSDCCLCNDCEVVPMEQSDTVLIDGSTGKFSTCDKLMLDLLTDSKEGDEQCVGAQQHFGPACCRRDGIEDSRRSLWGGTWSSFNANPTSSYNSFSVSNGWGSAPSKASTASFSFPPPAPAPLQSSFSGGGCNAICPASQMTRPCTGIVYDGRDQQSGYQISGIRCDQAGSIVRNANGANCSFLRALLPATCGCPGGQNNAAQFFNINSSTKCQTSAYGTWGIKGN